MYVATDPQVILRVTMVVRDESLLSLQAVAMS